MMSKSEITAAMVAAARQAFLDSTQYSTRRVTPDDSTISSMLRAAEKAKRTLTNEV